MNSAVAYLSNIIHTVLPATLSSFQNMIFGGISGTVLLLTAIGAFDL